MGVPHLRELRRVYGFDEVAIAPGSITINPELTSTDFSVDGITPVHTGPRRSDGRGLVLPALRENWTGSAEWP